MATRIRTPARDAMGNLQLGFEAPDEDAERPLEARAQTVHKLELMSRYWKSYPAILSHANGLSFCNSHIWLIDAMGGDGRHGSALDRDGYAHGSTPLACIAARAVQREVPGVTVHVRSIEADPIRAGELRRRAGRWLGAAPDGVDVEVLDGTFEARLDQVADEILRQDHPHSTRGRQHHDHRSLWFIDPFGPVVSHESIASLGRGTEVISNFDVGGLRRMIPVALDADLPGSAASLAKLDLTFGSRRWTTLAGASDAQIAQAYADTFPGYPIRKVYPLHSSRNQVRFMVHLTHSAKAEAAFRADYRTATTVGSVIAGDGMSDREKRAAAELLWKKFRSEELGIEQMFDAGVTFSRAQLRWICAQAELEGFGAFDTTDDLMTWFEARDNKPDLTLGL